MRTLILGIFLLVSMPAITFADEKAFRQQVYVHLMENSWVFPEELRRKAVKVGVIFSIDRDGKLLSAAVDQSSGSPDDDTAVLAGTERMQSFPRVPDELQAPYRFQTTFDFGPGPRFGYADLKWPPMSVNTSGQEIAFRSDLRHHLRLFPRILPEDVQIPHDVHSVIAFSIDRDGKLLDAKITKSFGIKTVDDGTLAWLKSIQPFPKMPPEVKAPMKLTAEIVFGPKGYDEEARRKVGGVCRGC